MAKFNFVLSFYKVCKMPPMRMIFFFFWFVISSIKSRYKCRNVSVCVCVCFCFVLFFQYIFSPLGPNALTKKGKRKVQGVPQSQAAAFPRHQEEEETDKTKQAQM